MSSVLLQLLADETNVAILQLLKIEPTYPRRLAGMLGKKEQKIVPRLKRMERAGMVRARWDRRGGKNVRLYEASLDRVELAIGVQGLEIVPHSVAKKEQSLPPPIYLPPKTGEKDPFFVGRGKELERISSRSNFVAVDGIAGIGKTSLLQAFADSLPRGSSMFWHTFKETDSFNHVVVKLATFLEQEHNFVDLLDYIRGDGKDDSTKLDLLVRGLERTENTLVFDDLQNQRDERIDSMFRHLQSNLSKAKVVVASRTRPGFLRSTSNVLEVRLEGLSSRDAVRLMRNRKVNLEEDQLVHLFQRTSGHPLALTLLSTILSENPGRSDDLIKEELPIGGLIDELLRSLGEEERSLLLALSVFRNPIPIEGIVHVVKLRGIRYLLHSLEKRLILKRGADNNFVLHGIVREGCYELVDSPEQLHRRIGEWYLKRGATQDILEGLHHLSKADEWTKVGEVLAQELIEERFHFVEEGHSNSLIGILEGAKTSTISPKLACAILCVKGRALGEAREWGKARSMLAQAKTIAKGLNDPGVMGCVYATMGKNHAARGDLRRAEDNFILSMGLLRRANDVEPLRRLQLEMARLYFVKGDVAEAMRFVVVGPRGLSEESADSTSMPLRRHPRRRPASSPSPSDQGAPSPSQESPPPGRRS